MDKGKIIKDIGTGILTSLGIRLGMSLVDKIVDKVHEQRERVRVTPSNKK